MLDPTLGTEAEFKALVAAFHDAGIKVLLDVVTHGVTYVAGQGKGGSKDRLPVPTRSRGAQAIASRSQNLQHDAPHKSGHLPAGCQAAASGRQQFSRRGSGQRRRRGSVAQQTPQAATATRTRLPALDVRIQSLGIELLCIERMCIEPDCIEPWCIEH